MKKTFDTDNDTEIKLKDILSFDIKAHKLKVQNIIVSTETLERMNKPDLQSYAAYQDELADQADKEGRHTESSGHKVNHRLAKLFLRQEQKLEAVKQSSFDAWKATGFSAGPEYIDLIRECKNEGSFEVLAGYSGFLADSSFELNRNLAAYIGDAYNDHEESSKKAASMRTIPFIYRGITTLRPEHSARFETAVRSGSVQSIRALARELHKCGYYSDQLISNLFSSAYFSDKIAEERTAWIVLSFGEEIKVCRIEKILKSKLETIKTIFGVDPGFGTALENMDASAFVTQFNKFVARGEEARKHCAELLGAYKMLYKHLSNPI